MGLTTMGYVINGPKNFGPSQFELYIMQLDCLGSPSFIHLLAPSSVFQKFLMYLYKHSISQVMDIILNTKLSYRNFSLIIVFSFNPAIKNIQMCGLFVIISPSIDPYGNDCIIHLIDGVCYLLFFLHLFALQKSMLCVYI